MKNARLFFYLIIFLVATTLYSCNDDDDVGYWVYYGPNATVTIKPLSDDAFYMQLDDTTTLFATNVTNPPYGQKEVRAFINFTEVDKVNNDYTMSVRLNYVDSMLTKKSIPYSEENNLDYGNDPIEIVPSWINVVEDGYITLYFSTLWGNNSIAHSVNLLTGVNPDDPYEVEFRHNAFGDVIGAWGNGVVAFKLPNFPVETSENVNITLKYNSFSGQKTIIFENIQTKYLTRGTPIIDVGVYGTRLK